MKKLFLLGVFALTMSATMNAQTTEPSSNNGNFYASTGLSVTNSENVNQESFASVEVGYSLNNFSYGAVVGSTNLGFENYWYEGKVAYSFNVVKINPYVLVGAGSYFGSTSNSSDLFIEYGAGISVPLGNISPYVQVSNWDSANYVTFGLTFNL